MSEASRKKGERTRQRVLDAIRSFPEPVASGDLVEPLGIDKATVLGHIAKLYLAGLVDKIGSGKGIRYQAAEEGAERSEFIAPRTLLSVGTVPEPIMATLMTVSEMGGEVAGPWSLALRMGVSHHRAARLIATLLECRGLEKIPGTEAYRLGRSAYRFVDPRKP